MSPAQGETQREGTGGPPQGSRIPKCMLINVILEEESRVAIVDNGVLDFFEIETLGKQTLKGSIYKGIVENVNASLEAAFVNCGWEKPGFLPLDEVNFRVLPSIKSRKGGSKRPWRLNARS